MLGVGGLERGARGWVAGLGRPVGCSGALGV